MAQLACNERDPGLISGLRNSPGEGISYPIQYSGTYLVTQLVKNPLQCGKPGFNLWVGKIPLRRERRLQYSDLENSMTCIDHGVTKSQTQQSNFHFHVWEDANIWVH